MLLLRRRVRRFLELLGLRETPLRILERVRSSILGDKLRLFMLVEMMRVHVPGEMVWSFTSGEGLRLPMEGDRLGLMSKPLELDMDALVCPMPLLTARRRKNCLELLIG